jgi:hypothetical protein
VSISCESENFKSVPWDGRTPLTALTDAELREIADDAGRRERRLVVRRRWRRHDRPFAAEVGLDPAVFAAALRDAGRRGWVRSELGGIGSVYARPVGKTELTPEGRKQLEEQ